MIRPIQHFFDTGFFQNSTIQSFELELDNRVRQSFDMIPELNRVRSQQDQFSAEDEEKATEILKQAGYPDHPGEMRLRALVIVQQNKDTPGGHSNHVEAVGGTPPEFAQSCHFKADHGMDDDSNALAYSIFRYPVDWERAKDKHPADQQIADIRRCEKSLDEGRFPRWSDYYRRNMNKAQFDAVWKFHFIRLTGGVYQTSTDDDMLSRHPACFIRAFGLAVLQTFRKLPYTEEDYEKFGQEIIDNYTLSLTSRPRQYSGMTTEQGTTGGCAGAVVSQSSINQSAVTHGNLGDNQRRIIADSLFNMTQLGVSTFGRLASLSILADAIKDCAVKGRSEQNPRDVLFEIEFLARRLAVSTVDVAQDTHKYTIESALRLADEVDHRDSDIRLPTVDSGDVLGSLGIFTNTPILNPPAFDDFSSDIANHTISPYQQASKSKLYRIQPSVRAEPADHDIIDNFKSRLDLLHISALPPIMGSLERTAQDPNHGMAKAFGLLASVPTRPRSHSSP